MGDPPPALALQTDLELRALVGDYWARVDRTAGTDPDWRALFMPDATMVLGTLHLTGRDAIIAFLEKRGADEIVRGRTTRHVVTNMRVRLLDDDRAALDATVVVFAGVGEWPLPAGAPSGLGDFRFVGVREPEAGWRFQTITAVSVFADETAPAFAQRRSQME